MKGGTGGTANREVVGAVATRALDGSASARLRRVEVECGEGGRSQMGGHGSGCGGCSYKSPCQECEYGGGQMGGVGVESGRTQPGGDAEQC